MIPPPLPQREIILDKLSTCDDELIRELAEQWEIVPENHWIPGPPDENGPLPVQPFNRAELISQLVSIDTFTID